MAESLTVESLVESDVLVPVQDGEFSLTTVFQDAVAGYREQPQQRTTEAFQSRFEEFGRGSSLDSTDEYTGRFVAQLLALADRLDDVPFETVVSAGFVVNQFAEGPFRESGVPEEFVPITGRQLAIVRVVCPRAVVYIWREDCEPCEVMLDALESMSSRFPDGVARFAVYGPDSARYLHEEYDVQGGPATLFIADGSVESRLYGAQYEEVVDTELEALADEAK